MSKTLTFLIFLVFLWCVVAGSPEDSQDSRRSVCLLEDPKNQCGSFCLFALKPLLDHIAKHQDQWSTSDALGLNETQAKLDRIEGKQVDLEKTLRATLPLQDIEEKLNRLTSQQETLISNNKETLRKLERLISQDLGAKLDRMKTQQTLWQQKLIEKLAEPQQHFEVQKKALEDQVKYLQGKLASTQNSTESKYIPPDFQKIAQRYFYIERNIKLNWYAASDTCRRMGGQLAIIENEAERQALASKVNAPSDVGFWLDIHNLANKFEYTSSATGKGAPFIKWGRGQPNVFKEDCIALDAGEMHDYNCVSKLFFICQA